MFDSKEDHFEIVYKETVMKVERLNIPGYTAFQVVFSSQRKPLVVARGMHADDHEFWTSIPEGRQKEAEGMGKLIEAYFQSKE